MLEQKHEGKRFIQNFTINQEGLRDNTNKLDHHHQLLPAEYPPLPPSGNRECLLLLPILISAHVGYVGVKAEFS